MITLNNVFTGSSFIIERSLLLEYKICTRRKKNISLLFVHYENKETINGHINAKNPNNRLHFFSFLLCVAVINTRTKVGNHGEKEICYCTVVSWCEIING